MNRQAVQDVTALRLEANSLRRDAQRKGLDAGTRARLLEDAEAALTTAIATLKRELRVTGKQSLTASERGELRELLSSTIGSLGGTYRDAKDYDRAIIGEAVTGGVLGQSLVGGRSVGQVGIARGASMVPRLGLVVDAANGRSMRVG